MHLSAPTLPAEPFEERQEFNLHETHFDIITKPAPGMSVLGWGKNTPVQMCCVGDHFLGARPCCAWEVSAVGCFHSMPGCMLCQRLTRLLAPAAGLQGHPEFTDKCVHAPRSCASDACLFMHVLSAVHECVLKLNLFCTRYMEADLQERIKSGNLPKEVAEAALRDLKENPVTEEAWRDMQRLLKTFLKIDHPDATVFDRKHW